MISVKNVVTVDGDMHPPCRLKCYGLCGGYLLVVEIRVIDRAPPCRPSGVNIPQLEVKFLHTSSLLKAVLYQQLRDS